MRKPLRLLTSLGSHLAGALRTPSPDPDASLRSARIDALLDWLSLAQDRTPDGGVSEGYHLYHGWLPSYPETTGYIVETFLDQRARVGDDGLRDRALRMTDWLLNVQRPDGSIPDARLEHPMVFDTGQVIFGFVRAFRETEDERYRRAAMAGGDWLVDVQDDDGAWRRHAMRSIPHTYYSRVGWALALLDELVQDGRYAEAARRNARWTAAQQRENGWFDQAAFRTDQHPTPVTHTIAYTIRGLFEMGVALGEAEYVDRAERAMDGLTRTVEPGDLPAGTYDRGWGGDRRFSCLTGNAQLAIVALRLAQTRESARWLERGAAINRAMGGTHDVATGNRNVRGAVAGSYPVWGDYIHFAYPNWAAKFYAESLMLEEKVEAELARAEAP